MRVPSVLKLLMLTVLLPYALQLSIITVSQVRWKMISLTSS